MKTIILASVVSLSLFGCGYISRDTELVGQVKKVTNNTPLLCPDYKTADISLGVMRNGVGSMSTQDVWIVVDTTQAEVMKAAVETGEIVKITYDMKRITFCTPHYFASKVEIIK